FAQDLIRKRGEIDEMKPALLNASNDLVQERRLEKRMKEKARIAVPHDRGGVRVSEQGRGIWVFDRQIAEIFWNDILTVQIDDGIRKELVGAQTRNHSPLKSRLKIAME